MLQNGWVHNNEIGHHFPFDKEELQALDIPLCNNWAGIPQAAEHVGFKTLLIPLASLVTPSFIYYLAHHSPHQHLSELNLCTTSLPRAVGSELPFTFMIVGTDWVMESRLQSLWLSSWGLDWSDVVDYKKETNVSDHKQEEAGKKCKCISLYRLSLLYILGPDAGSQPNTSTIPLPGHLSDVLSSYFCLFLCSLDYCLNQQFKLEKKTLARNSYLKISTQK